MTVETDRQYLERIRELAGADDREGLDAATSALDPSEVIRATLRGLMITEFLQVGENATVGETLDALVVNAEDTRDAADARHR